MGSWPGETGFVSTHGERGISWEAEMPLQSGIIYI